MMHRQSNRALRALRSPKPVVMGLKGLQGMLEAYESGLDACLPPPLSINLDEALKQPILLLFLYFQSIFMPSRLESFFLSPSVVFFFHLIF